jgi:hypothetical protein
VFAGLGSMNAAPPLDGVLDCERWRFAVLSRSEMYRAVVFGKSSPQKTVGLATLRNLTSFVSGPELPSRLTGDCDGDGAPRRRMDIVYAEKLGVPVEPADDVVPEAIADTVESEDH